MIETGGAAINGRPLTGAALAEELRSRYHLIMEKTTADYALAMTSAADTEEGFRRLGDALLAIDGTLTDSSAL